MKKVIYIIMLLSGFFGSAQVFVNGTSTTTANTTNSSVLLEFQSGLNKGIILPWTSGEVTAPANGTFILDTSARKVKVFSNNAWFDLSGGARTENAIDFTLQSAPFTESTDAKVVIGEETSTADGILVLEATDKAMVLPKVEDPHLNIANPAPGIMVYDSVNNLLCLYNGTEWSYWKPGN